MRLIVCLAAIASSLVAPVHAGAQRPGQNNDKRIAAETKAPLERLLEYINAQCPGSERCGPIQIHSRSTKGCGPALAAQGICVHCRGFRNGSLKQRQLDMIDTLSGFIWNKGLAKAKTTLPKPRWAAQWLREDTPADTRGPIPEEVLALSVNDPVYNVEQRHVFHSLMAAAAETDSWDLLGRPSGTVKTAKDDAVPPQGRKNQNWGAMFSQSGRRGDGRPAQNKEFVEIAFVGLDCDRQGRGPEILEELWRQCEAYLAPLLSSLDLGHFVRQIFNSMQSLELSDLGLSPYETLEQLVAVVLRSCLLIPPWALRSASSPPGFRSPSSSFWRCLTSFSRAFPSLSTLRSAASSSTPHS